MISHVVNLTVPNATAEQFYDFMITPDDKRYNEWWPEEHLQYHITKHGDKNHLGDEVYYDENVGKTRRLAFHAIVTVAERPNTIVWRMKKAGIRLPAYLKLGLLDSPDGLAVRHEVNIGYEALLGKLLDPFIKLYFNKSFQNALETHCRTEWPKLGVYIKGTMLIGMTEFARLDRKHEE